MSKGNVGKPLAAEPEGNFPDILESERSQVYPKDAGEWGALVSAQLLVIGLY